MSEEKRKRSPNWLPSEKTLLLDLIETHRNIIENKKTDAVTMKQKFSEWKIIAESYNSNTSYCSRSAENLKSQWDYMKKNAKKEESKNRIHKIQTGGGPALPKKEDPTHSKIISIIKTSAVGLYNPFDNDAESCDDVATTQTQVFIPEEEVLDQDMEVENVTTPSIETNSKNKELQESQDWGDYTPKMLRTPVSAPLRLNRELQKDEQSPKSGISKKRPKYTASSLEKVHEKKIEIIEFQRSVAEKEAMHLAESQELDIQIKKLDIQIRREQLKQEKIKTRNLLLDLRLKKKNRD